VTEIGGALVRHAVRDGYFGARVWADRAPAGATLPYLTVTDAITVNPAISGDGSSWTMWSRQMQVSVWERASAEDPAVLRKAVALLAGVDLRVDGFATRIRVDSVTRILEEDTNIVQHALTLSLAHGTSRL
jgi:hypothetical protein